MQEKTNDREQPNAQMLIADANISEQNEFEKIEKENNTEMQNGSLGKFKNTQSLLDAYNNLQAEFTRKCQKLKEFEKSNEENHPESLQNENKQKMSPVNMENSVENNLPKIEQVVQFEQAQDTQREKENAGLTSGSESITNLNNQAKQNQFKQTGLGQMIASSQENSNQTIQSNEELLKNDEFIKNFIKTHSDIKEEILKSYLEEVQKTKSPKVILSSVGSGLPLIAPPKPTNLEEAKEIIKKMFD